MGLIVYEFCCKNFLNCAVKLSSRRQQLRRGKNGETTLRRRPRGKVSADMGPANGQILY